MRRQLEDCRAIVDRNGWVVADEYVDNDVSAFRGAVRPEYERMLVDIGAGRVDAVVVYHQDRLTRRPIEFEQFNQVCEAAGMTRLVSVTGDIRIGNDNGLLIARITAAVAANESARKSERIKRKQQQNAQLGLPGGGSQRPFGYEPDKVTVRESEAVVIRELVERYLAGESLRSLTQWLNDEGVPTAGKSVAWRSGSVRNVLFGARIAGLRQYRGEVVGPAVWPGIITPGMREQVLARMRARTRTRTRAARSYLLTGLLRCGRCGGHLFSSRKADRSRRYVCVSGPDHGGCGRLTVVAGPLEELISQAVLMRLDTPELAATLADRHGADVRYGALIEQVNAAQARIDEAAVMFGSGEISRPELLKIRQAAEAKMTGAQRQIDQATQSTTLDRLAGQGQAIRAGWEGLNLDRQRVIVAAVMEYATILPGSPTATALDPNRVVPTWTC